MIFCRFFVKLVKESERKKGLLWFSMKNSILIVFFSISQTAILLALMFFRAALKKFQLKWNKIMNNNKKTRKDRWKLNHKSSINFFKNSKIKTNLSVRQKIFYLYTYIWVEWWIFKKLLSYLKKIVVTKSTNWFRILMLKFNFYFTCFNLNCDALFR